MPYEEPPFNRTAADRKITEISGKLLDGTATTEDLCEIDYLAKLRTSTLVQLQFVGSVLKNTIDKGIM